MKTKRGTQMKNKRPFFRMKKSDNRGIHVKGKWKAVDLDPSLFSDEGMDGLVCFEELTEYSLVDSDKVAANALKQEKKGRKRKSSEVEEGEGESDATKTAEKPAKKNKKRQVSRDAKHESTPVDNVDQNNQVSIKKEGTEEGSPNETSTEDSATCSQIDVESKSVMEQKKIDKNKNRKKNQKKKKQQAAKERMLGTVPKSTVDANDLEKEQPSKKGGKPPKNKAKNWTNAALSCSSDQNTDMDAWKDLFVPAPVLKALSCLGFGSPTPIQALALPPAIRDHMDILGAAETGSGKTLSFAIPMIHTILEWKKGTPEQDGDQDELTGELETESPATLRSDESVETGNGADLVTRQEHKTEPAGEEDGGEGVTGQDEADVEENVSDDDDLSEVENEDGRIGCVKVIKDVEFDFGDAAEAEDGTIGSQNQPLLGLVLTPTRELAVQVKHHIDAVAKFTDIKTAIIVGGMSQQKQSRMLNRRPEIVIATPGRLWELIRERHPHLLSLRQLKCLVIDEADRMVERGHFAELENLLEMLSTTYFNPKRQMFVFSATLTMAPSVPIRLLQKKKRLVQRNKLEVLMEKIGITSKPKVIDLTRKEATVESLTETQIHCAKDEKDFFLYYFLLQYPGRTMVFANSIDCIKRLNSLLVILDCTPLPLHANMHQKQRLKNLERFAERQSCVLLTTDVAARGLDIPNVQHVIHYQIPRTSETYVHRSGRTARATKEGLSLLLTSPEDMLNFKKIYRSLGKDEELPIFPIQTKCMEAIKERVNLARQIEKIEFHNSKEKHHNSWFRQAAEALEVDLDDDVLMGRDRDEDDDRQQQRMVKGMKKHLKHLVSQPVFKNEIKTKYPTQMGRLSLPIMPRAGVESAITSVSNQKKKPKKAKRQH